MHGIGTIKEINRNMAKKPKKTKVEPLPTKAEVAAGDGQGAKRARRQTQIPGTERKEIPALTELAEKVREACKERLAQQKVEADARTDLATAIEALQVAGTIPRSEPGEKKIVYRYEDEDGVMRKVVDNFTRKIQVVADTSADDEGEE